MAMWLSFFSVGAKVSLLVSRSMNIESKAKLACLYSGAAWGLFWIPLRQMDAAGINGAWATVMFYVVPAILFLPWGLWHWRRLRRCGKLLHLIGISAGVSLVLYANAMLYTEIVRGVALYYLTPVWSFILARVVLREAITTPRIVAIVFGISGMLVLFGVDIGLPLPRNAGDWMGLLGGIGWAVAAVFLRQDDGKHAVEICVVYFSYAAVFAVVMALLPIVSGHLALPELSVVISVLPWFLPVAIVLVISGAYAAFWGAPHLNPGVVGILFMTEISIAAVTAAIWAGEPFGWREISGILLISLAGLSEFIVTRTKRLLGSPRENSS